MKISVNYPGHWAHGREFHAEAQTLTFRGGDSVQNRYRSRTWDARRVEGGYEVDCFIVHDKNYGRFAIPTTLCIELKVAA